jgi:hypothetical protein
MRVQAQARPNLPNTILNVLSVASCVFAAFLQLIAENKNTTY